LYRIGIGNLKGAVCTLGSCLKHLFGELDGLEAGGPEDVDLLLYSDFADGIEIEQIVDHYVQEKQVQVQEEPMQVQANLLPDPLEGNVPLQVFELKPAVKMPRRWQPWKFITVAMVIPWLLMHATQLHEPSLSKRAAPPMLHKASLPVVLHFVPMHEANWPK